jgi:hypothetical protein
MPLYILQTNNILTITSAMIKYHISKKTKKKIKYTHTHTDTQAYIYDFNVKHQKKYSYHKIYWSHRLARYIGYQMKNTPRNYDRQGTPGKRTG